ncbi:MAG: hypothetical protein JOY70_07935 [Acidisphaera sp.]|nr:hypothetical protein [Acidisphaera sp.]MBV9813447.1 hypothetical protein [Acetobacteraceae bacterium]
MAETQCDEGSRRSAEIIPFPARPRGRRLSRFDRAEASEWAARIGRDRPIRIAICEEPDPEIGDFVLVYDGGRDWASWGVSRDGGRFSAWQAAGPGVIGRFASMTEALEAIREHGERRPRRRRGSAG